MEREALAVWEQKRLLEKDLKKSEVQIPESASQPDSQQSSESKTDLENGEEDRSLKLSQYKIYFVSIYVRNLFGWTFFGLKWLIS